MEQKTRQEQILEIAQAMTGADEGEQAMLAMLAAAQEKILQRALRAGTAPEDCGEAYLCAAGLLSAAALEAVRAGGEEISSLRAGDMTITRRASGAREAHIRLLREEAWTMMEPYTKGGDFYFCRTQS